MVFLEEKGKGKSRHHSVGKIILLDRLVYLAHIYDTLEFTKLSCWVF